MITIDLGSRKLLVSFAHPKIESVRVQRRTECNIRQFLGDNTEATEELAFNPN